MITGASINDFFPLLDSGRPPSRRLTGCLLGSIVRASGRARRNNPPERFSAHRDFVRLCPRYLRSHILWSSRRVESVESSAVQSSAAQSSRPLISSRGSEAAEGTRGRWSAVRASPSGRGIPFLPLIDHK